MSLMESVKFVTGKKIPSFELRDPYDHHYKSDQLFGKKGLLLAVTCNHCPYAQAIWPRLIRLADYAKEIGVNTVAVNPNIHPDYPEDAPDQMKNKIEEWKITFPYLVDDTQALARQLKAQCTPDLYLYNSKQELVYHGRLDDNWQNEKAVKREELKEAINCLVSGKPIPENQHPSMGCSIKWCNN